jgi:hypothetical protein
MSTTTIEKKTATQIPAKAKTTRKKAVAAPMNPPTAPAVEDTNKAEIETKKAQEAKDIETLKEAKKRKLSISKSLNNVQSSFTRIAFDLHWISSTSAFGLLGYKNIYDYAAKEHGIARGTCSDFIHIVERFAKRDDAGNILEEIRPELKDYQSSKLIALLGVTDAQLTEFSVDMSVRDIKKKVKELHGEAQDETQGEPQGKTVEADISNGKAIIDTTAQEVNSQTLVTFHNIDDYNKYLDGLNDLIEKALKSKNFEADHKRIEIVVKW